MHFFSNKFRCINYITLSILWVVASCSGGGVKSKSDVDGALTLNVKNSSGGNQSINPKTSLANPVIFEIKDSTGNPVPAARVEFKLVDVTDKEEVLDEMLPELWDSNPSDFKVNAKDQNSADEDIEDRVGRIERSSDKTNQSGSASVSVFSSVHYDKKIAILAKVVKDDFGANGIGFAVYKTSSVAEDNLSLLITTTNGNAEYAGEPFAIWLSVIRGGTLLKAFEDKITLNITSVFPESWAFSSMPNGSYDCQFLSGRCQLSGEQFVLRGAGTAEITIKDPKNIFDDSLSEISVLTGKPEGIILSLTPPEQGVTDACPRLEKRDSETEPCIVISADNDSFTLYPTIVDKGGNFISIAENVSWRIVGEIAKKVDKAVSGGDVKTFKPWQSDMGYFEVTSIDGFVVKNGYKIVPGKPSYYKIVTEHVGEEIATQPFLAKVTLFDRKDNQCDNYQGDRNVTLKFDSVTSSPNNTVPYPKNNESVADTISFFGGVGYNTIPVQVTNAMDTPKIIVSGDLGEALSDPISVDPGSIVLARWRTSANNGGIEFLSPESYTIDDRPNFYVAGYDALGNFKSDILSDFTVSTGLVGTLSATSGIAASPVALSSCFGTITAQPRISGVSAITTPEISFISAQAVAYQINTTHNRVENVGYDFDIILKAVDPQGNIDINYDGVKNLQFTVISQKSWLGIAPDMPDTMGAVTCNFVNGICNLPYPSGKTGFRIADSRQPTLINVADIDGFIPDAWSAFITPVRGAASEIIFATKAGGPTAGAEVWHATGDTTYTTSYLMSTDNTVTIAAALIDITGNFVSNASASWQGTATTLHPYLSSYGPISSVVFSPNKPQDSGTITASVPGYADEVLNINVIHGLPVKVDFGFENGLVHTAGECISLNMTVRDADDNVATTYNGAGVIKMGIKNHVTGSFKGRFENISGSLSLAQWTSGVGPRLRFVTGFYDLVSTTYSPTDFSWDAVFSSAPYNYYTGTT